MVLKILHISDVHFGPPHLPHLSAEVLRLAEDRGPDLVVVSGDLSQRAKPGQFRQARRFVDSFTVPTIVVPGNHDVPLYRFWERFFDPYGAYRRHFSPELEPVLQTPDFLAIGINTAHGWTIDGGRIRKRRLDDVAQLISSAPDSVLKIVVAHHNLASPPRFSKRGVVSNAREAMHLLSRAGVDFILSGHNHQSFVADSEDFYPTGRPPVVILQSGTTTSDRGRESEKGRNTCFWLQVDKLSTTISRLRWEPGLERFAERSRHLYPRRDCDPYTLEASGGTEPETRG